MHFDIEILAPIYSELLKDCNAQIVKVSVQGKNPVKFIHLEYWGIEEFNRNVEIAKKAIMELK